MSMDQFLAEYYGTGKTATVEATEDETQKTAQVELFAKMAAAQNIDLGSMTDEQVEQLYHKTFSKTASTATTTSVEKTAEEEEAEKKEKAKEEHEEKKAAAEKVAEADFLGRVMAHAYVQELNKIAEANNTETPVPAPEETKEAGKAGFLKNLEKGKDKAVGAVKAKAHDIGSAAKKHFNKAEKAVKGKAEEAHKSMKKNPGKFMAGAGGAGLAAGAAGGYAAGKSKESSAIDDLAAERAVEKAAEAGWDSDEVSTRIAALMILGPSEEGTKIASAANVDQAVDIRAAELLEQAGYPVNWE